MNVTIKLFLATEMGSCLINVSANFKMGWLN